MTGRLTSLARLLRKNATEAERALWKVLRSKRFEGFKFRRQQPLEGYIVDFVCFEKRLVIEVDASRHAGSKKDEERDRVLTGHGFKVLRFWNNDVLGNTEGVIEEVRRNL